MGTPTVPAARDYPRLFRAMNEVLRALSTDEREEDALRRSFEDAARGFGAEKALLLVVEEQQPLRLRRIAVQGLAPKQIEACERGESTRGVSSSVIRTVIGSPRALVVENPFLHGNPVETPALTGRNYSVLCAPVLDPAQNVTLAVMYFQKDGSDPEAAYQETDLVWLEGYASALGEAFAYHFQKTRRERALQDLLQGGQRPEDAPELIGESGHTQGLRRVLHETYIPAAGVPDPDPVLILGEKGTGKDLVARYLHAYSARRDRPFVVVSAAEISDDLAPARFFGHKKGSFTGAISDELGLFRAADQGVLFLDEITELSPRAQATLLRVLENRTVVPVGDTREVRVDVQVLLATNRDPEQAAKDGVLRADLLDRFGIQVIRLQPLRERPWDVPALVAYFLSHHERRSRKKTLGLTRQAFRMMVSHAWPGNVREVDRVCSLLVTHAKVGERLDTEFLERCYPNLAKCAPNPRAGAVLSQELSMREALRVLKRELILSRLEQHNWDVTAARQTLRLPRTTFNRYLVALGIGAPKPSPKEGLPPED
jgi:transcriptional regulator with GAF, ATPase, and Fis domain